MELGFWLAADNEKTVALINLREVNGQRLNPLFSERPIRGDCGLHDVDLAVAQ
ncbi:MAG TPA: hypothetical protein VKB88_38045 [Bryobacteraceae bacterium]|nr:hypothetical protein [Bryobacteraceae bacterium]